MILFNDMTSDFFDDLNMKEAILSIYREQNPPATNILKES